MALSHQPDLIETTITHPTEGPIPFARAKAVTWRSVLLCLLLLPINAYWVVQMEIVRYSAHPTTISLFFNIIFELLVLTLLNRLAQGFAPTRRLALNRAELMSVYSVLAAGSCLCGHDMFQFLVR